MAVPNYTISRVLFKNFKWVERGIPPPIPTPPPEALRASFCAFDDSNITLDPPFYTLEASGFAYGAVMFDWWLQGSFLPTWHSEHISIK